jgi:hypothetical protein
VEHYRKALVMGGSLPGGAIISTVSSVGNLSGGAGGGAAAALCKTGKKAWKSMIKDGVMLELIINLN